MSVILYQFVVTSSKQYRKETKNLMEAAVQTNHRLERRLLHYFHEAFVAALGGSPPKNGGHGVAVSRHLVRDGGQRGMTERVSNFGVVNARSDKHATELTNEASLEERGFLWKRRRSLQ